MSVCPWVSRVEANSHTKQSQRKDADWVLLTQKYAHFTALLFFDSMRDANNRRTKQKSLEPQDQHCCKKRNEWREHSLDDGLFWFCAKNFGPPSHLHWRRCSMDELPCCSDEIPTSGFRKTTCSFCGLPDCSNWNKTSARQSLTGFSCREELIPCDTPQTIFCSFCDSEA